MSFAVEKRRQLLLLLIVIALLQLKLGWWSLPLWLLFLGVAYLFRDFPRKPPAKPLDVLSPVDGKVIAIANEWNPFLKTDSVCVKIRQSMIGEFNLHSPIEGMIKLRWWPGKQSSDTTPGKSYVWWIRTDEEDDLVMAMLPRFKWLRSIHCDNQTGERIGQGKRCGFAGYNLEVSIYLPAQSAVSVEEGNMVLAGQSSIGRFVH